MNVPVSERVLPRRTVDDPGARKRRLSHDNAMVSRYHRDRDPAALALLMQRFAPLAEALAGRYRDSGEPHDDLVQVAQLGLLKAIRRFDPRRGVAFSSYAVPTMQGELKRYFRDRCWTVRPPRDLLERSLSVDHATADLTSLLQRRPSVTEIAHRVGLDAERVLEALEAGRAHHAISLETPRGAGGEDDETMADAMGRFDEGFAAVERRVWLGQLAHSLTAREREVLRLRFGEDLTQAHIGELIGVSQMQVSRILRHALRRLRDAAAELPDPVRAA